jgi:hypothetical protein
MIIGNVISPLAHRPSGAVDTLAELFTTFGLTAQWSADNIDVSGGTTTAYDYGLTDDLANASGEQPTLNASSAALGGRQTLTFAAGEGLEKAVANWRSSDNRGTLTWVCVPVATKTTLAFTSSDSATNNSRLFGNVNFGSANYLRVRNAGTTTALNDSAATNTTRLGPVVVTCRATTATSYHLFVNGIKVAENLGGGTAGQWLNDVTFRDNIAIGKLVDSTPNYGEMEWGLTNYYSDAMSDANVIAMHQQLMSYYGMTVALAMSELNAINPIINGWNYDWSYINGTTTTLVDLAGQYLMENQAAGGQPTMSANSLDFDGIANEVSNAVANYRSGDSTGVIHTYVDFDTAASQPIIFSSSDNASNTEYLLVQIRSGGEVRLESTLGSSVILETSATWTGWHVVSCVQDGVQASIFVDGVKVLAYDTSTLTTDWLDLSTANDGIAIGALLDLTPNYGEVDIKYVGYSAYVDDGTVTLEADKLLNSGL